MENQNGLVIRIEGNSIKFYTPSGEVYFKNLTNFKASLALGKKNFNAPASAVQKVLAPVVVEAATASFISAERV